MNPKPALVVLACLGLLMPAAAEVRTWTSTDGRTISAEFVKGDEKTVTIRKGTLQFTLSLEGHGIAGKVLNQEEWLDDPWLDGNEAVNQIINTIPGKAP